MWIRNPFGTLLKANCEDVKTVQDLRGWITDNYGWRWIFFLNNRPAEPRYSGRSREILRSAVEVIVQVGGSIPFAPHTNDAKAK